MKLSKIIPARKKTVSFLSCREDFQEMGDCFRIAIAGLKKKINGCWWCNHKFVDGEMMALACAEKEGNKIICQTCASELLSQE